jgi:hypothetical protein
LAIKNLEGANEIEKLEEPERNEVNGSVVGGQRGTALAGTAKGCGNLKIECPCPNKGEHWEAKG